MNPDGTGGNDPRKTNVNGNNAGGNNAGGNNAGGNNTGRNTGGMNAGGGGVNNFPGAKEPNRHKSTGKGLHNRNDYLNRNKITGNKANTTNQAYAGGKPADNRNRSREDDVSEREDSGYANRFHEAEDSSNKAMEVQEEDERARRRTRKAEMKAEADRRDDEGVMQIPSEGSGDVSSRELMEASSSSYEEEDYGILFVDSYIHYKFSSLPMIFGYFIELLFVAILLLGPSLLLLLITGKKFTIEDMLAERTKDDSVVLAIVRLNFCFFLYYMLDTILFLITENVFSVLKLIVYALGLTKSIFAWGFTRVVYSKRFYARVGFSLMISYMIFDHVFKDSNDIILFGFLPVLTLLLFIKWLYMYFLALLIVKIVINMMTFEIKRSSNSNDIITLNSKVFNLRKLHKISKATNGNGASTGGENKGENSSAANRAEATGDEANDNNDAAHDAAADNAAANNAAPNNSAIRELAASIEPSYDTGIYLKYYNLFKSNEEASNYVNKIFARLGKKSLSYEDIELYYPRNPSTVFYHFSGRHIDTVEDDEEEKKFISKKEMTIFAQNLYHDQVYMRHTLKDRDSVFEKLDLFFCIIVTYAFFILLLFMFQMDYKYFMATFGTAFLTFSWVFSDSIKNIYTCFLFLLIVRPYNVGDNVMIEQEKMSVYKIDLLTTTFLTTLHKKVYISNVRLVNMNIYNIARSPGQSEIIEIKINPQTLVFEKTKELEENVSKELKNVRSIFPSCKFYSVVDGKLSYEIEHSKNFHNRVRLRKEREKLIRVFIKTMDQTGIQYENSFSFRD